MIKTNQASFYADFHATAALKVSAQQDQQAALKKTAQQFESVFVGMMLKSMRQAHEVFKQDNITSSDGVNFYQGMFDQQLSVHLSEQGGMGLSRVIEEQLSPTANVSTAPSSITSGTAIDSVAAPIFKEPEDFIKHIYPLIEKHAVQHGIDPKIVMSQAALETGWGQGMTQLPTGQSSHNLFNIKSKPDWAGAVVHKDTIEYQDDIPSMQREQFKSYHSYDESIADYFKLLEQSPRYQEALQHKSDPESFIQSLQQAGYATDPKYSIKVMSVYHSSRISRL